MFYEDDSKSRRLDWELTSRPRLSSSLQPARSQTYAGSIGALFKSEEFSTELIIHLAALFREAQIHSYISWQAAETAALLKKSSYTFSHKCGFFFFLFGHRSQPIIWFGGYFRITSAGSQSEKELTYDPVHVPVPQDLISGAIQRCEVAFQRVPKRFGLFK